MKKLLLLTAILSATFCSAGENTFRYKLGGYIFYALNNNTGRINDSLIANIDKDKYDKFKNLDWNQNAVNYFVLDNGQDKILFDAGHALNNGGHILARLEEIKMSPEDITIICLTHMHADHIGGLLDDYGQKLFPNAKVYISAEEAAYWATTGNELAKNVLKQYSLQIKRFTKNEAITEGVKSVPLFGHTPGHSGFYVENQGAKLLVWGDLLHSNLQFVAPDVYLKYDMDGAKATKIRKAILKKAAKEGFDIAGMHVVVPGTGSVEKDGKGYKFIALK